MRIAMFDDLHTEFGAYQIAPLGVDVIILAGDIANTPEHYAQVVMLTRDTNLDAAILCVLGNHEFHGRSWNTAVDDYRETLSGIDEHVHFLENDSVTIGGLTFVGATLCTDINVMDGIAIAQTLEDYRPTGIYVDEDDQRRQLTPNDVTIRHRESLRYIESMLRRPDLDPDNIVIITHHAPSIRSWEERPGPLSPAIRNAYCNNLDAMIEGYKPSMWIHGHLHHTQSYLIGETIIASNPRGYLHNGKAENTAFDDMGRQFDLGREPTLSRTKPHDLGRSR